MNSKFQDNIKRVKLNRKKRLKHSMFPELVRTRRYHLRHKEQYKKDECQECNSTEKLELHHQIYNKDIMPKTLCKSCHIKHHINWWKVPITI